MAIRKPITKPKKRRQPRSVDASPISDNVWRDLVEIGKRVPKDVRAKLPRDLAENFDHYHDGSPRQD